MTPEFNRLPKTIQERLRPLLPAMQREATKAGIPLNALISVAAEESAGNASAVGDRNLPQPALGLYQVRDRGYWLGGADPLDAEKATAAIAPRFKKLLDSCNGDLACLHYKMMAGPAAKYTPEAVAERSKRFPHVGQRLDRVRGMYGDAQAQERIDAMPAWGEAGAGRGLTGTANDTSTAAMPEVSSYPTLPPLPKVDPVDAAREGFYEALMGLSPYADASAPVKSRKRTNILGL